MFGNISISFYSLRRSDCILWDDGWGFPLGSSGWPDRPPTVSSHLSLHQQRLLLFLLFRPGLQHFSVLPSPVRSWVSANMAVEDYCAEKMCIFLIHNSSSQSSMEWGCGEPGRSVSCPVLVCFFSCSCSVFSPGGICFLQKKTASLQFTCGCVQHKINELMICRHVTDWRSVKSGPCPHPTVAGIGPSNSITPKGIKRAWKMDGSLIWLF